MPTSLALGKPLTGLVLGGLAADGNVRRVVDVGPGLGVYARLFRNLTGTANWTAVEAWGPYVDTYDLEDWYDDIVIADVRYLDFNKLGAADVILFGDVLEHMSAGEAMDVLDRASRRVRFMILSIPLGHWPQDEIDGNPFEAHVEDNLSADRVQAMVPGLCGGQAYINEDGNGIGLFFAAGDPSDRDYLQSLIARKEACLEEGAAPDLLKQISVNFSDDTDLGRFRDAVAGLAAN